MTEPETYAGIYNSLIEAEIRAGELQAQGKLTRIEYSKHHFKWVVHSAPRIEEVA